jgi:biopolymer transport protein ExbD
VAVKLAIAQSASARRISLTPLIDVVFILLLFFILETNFLTTARVSLGISDAGAQSSAQQTSFEVQIFNNQQLWVDGEAVAMGEWGAYLDARQLDPETAVILKPEGEVSLQDIVSVTDALQQRGLNKTQLKRLGL